MKEKRGVVVEILWAGYFMGNNYFLILGLEVLYNFTIASCKYTFCCCWTNKRRKSYVDIDEPDGSTEVFVDNETLFDCIHLYAYN